MTTQAVCCHFVVEIFTSLFPLITVEIQFVRKGEYETEIIKSGKEGLCKYNNIYWK
jgi:hypothetical protein